MKHKIMLRNGYSDRNGITTVSKEMQVKGFDVRTRNLLFNLIQASIECLASNDAYCEARKRLYMKTKSELFGEKITDVPYSSHINDILLEMYGDIISNGSYDEVLTLLEFICNYIADCCYKGIYGEFNKFFEKEYIGYRFIDGLIVPISNECESSSIEEAIKNSDKIVSNHLNKALAFLSSRTSPDYENSIKESIMAVEAYCNIICGKKATLGETLKLLEDKVAIHPALKIAFEKLYGYTSDSEGVRHAGLLGDVNSTFEEARFMIVSCSAFINYLKCENSK